MWIYNFLHLIISILLIHSASSIETVYESELILKTNTSISASEFGIIKFQLIPPTVRGGFYSRLAEELKYVTSSYLRNKLLDVDTHTHLLQYVSAVKAIPSGKTREVTNYYFVEEFGEDCPRAELTQNGNKKLMAWMKKMSGEYAAELAEPIQIVPMFVVLHKNFTKCKENKNEVKGPLGPRNMIPVYMDKYIPWEGPILASLIGTAHYLEGFNPGVMAFLQNGLLLENDFLVPIPTTKVQKTTTELPADYDSDIYAHG